VSLLACPEIGGNQEMRRWMVDPITSQFFHLEECHRVNHRIAVSAGGGEKAVNGCPIYPSVDVLAPKLGSGAMASPEEGTGCLRPEPLSTALRTGPALPRSSRFSTVSVVISG